MWSGVFPLLSLISQSAMEKSAQIAFDRLCLTIRCSGVHPLLFLWERASENVVLLEKNWSISIANLWHAMCTGVFPSLFGTEMRLFPRAITASSDCLEVEIHKCSGKFPSSSLISMLQSAPWCTSQRTTK